MADLISRTATLAALDQHAHGATTLGGQTYRSITLEVAVEAIRALPAVAASQTPDPVVKSDSCQSVRVKPLEWVGGDILVATGPDVRVVGHVTEASTKDRYEAERTERILAEIEMQPTPRDAVSDAARDVLAERQRQISAEGWTIAHDDRHAPGELAGAAACYAMQAALDSIGDRRLGDTVRATIGELWPWLSSWWKPSTNRRDLVKAGALILAEIERLDRAEKVGAADYNRKVAQMKEDFPNGI